MEATLRIASDGTVEVSCEDGGVVARYTVPFEALAEVLVAAAREEQEEERWLATPVLPPGALAFARAEESRAARLFLAWGPEVLPFDYEGTLFPAVPYPRLVFGLGLAETEGGWRVNRVEVAAVKERGKLAPSTPLFHYPYSHVAGTSMCIGHAPLPDFPELAALDAAPRFILTVPNSDHHYSHRCNASGMVLRQLLETVNGREEFPEEWLVPLGFTLGEWVERASGSLPRYRA